MYITTAGKSKRQDSGKIENERLSKLSPDVCNTISPLTCVVAVLQWLIPFVEWLVS